MAGSLPQILFIHGQFLTTRVWDAWRNYVDALGIGSLAQAWPGPRAFDVARRVSSPKDLKPLELDDVLEHYVEVVEAMAEPPIIIGHSLGGLIVQLLIQRGMGAVGVAIAPTPPHRRFMLDVPLQLSDDAALERCNLASTLKLISFEAFQYAVANELAYEAQSEAYQEYASPQSMRVVLSAVSETASIDVHLPHTPLLFIAGGSDRTVPADVIRSIFERYKHGSASSFQFPLKCEGDVTIG